MALSRADNEIYRRKGHVWWDEDAYAASLRFFINPVRFGYFRQVLAARRKEGWEGRTVLDVGCGGGFLSEEFAKAGFTVTGVDPAEESIECARRHAAESGLRIDYCTGCGEDIPAQDESFDIILCCDVLEHVEDCQTVLREVSRVAKPGGIFFYDTVNRTLASYIVVIKLLQDWALTAQHEPLTHAWKQFITPCELSEGLARAGLVAQEHKGIGTRSNPLAALLDLRRRVTGKISYRELGSRLGLHATEDTRVSYMGYALKSNGPVGAEQS